MNVEYNFDIDNASDTKLQYLDNVYKLAEQNTELTTSSGRVIPPRRTYDKTYNIQERLVTREYGSLIIKSVYNERHFYSEKSGFTEEMFILLKDKSCLYLSLDYTKNAYLESIFFQYSGSKANLDVFVKKLKNYKFNNSDMDEHQTVNYYFFDKQGLKNRVFDIESTNKFFPECYPWIDNPHEYMERFKESNSKILILLGPPGTGKTTFIKEMLLYNNWSSICAYDMDVMSDDTFYINFLSTGEEVMVLEDADLLLEGRLTQGNATMSKLLNVSDGLVSGMGKKFIFTANIQNKSGIDEALVRPGRCFDIMEFRDLQGTEVEALAKATGIEYNQDRDVSISEFFNKKMKDKQKSKVGFR